MKIEEPDNKSSTTYSTHNKVYFDKKLFSDLSFICSDGVRIQAHRFAIFPSSSIWKNMINIGPNSIIQISDIDSTTMNEILRYIYVEEVNDIDKFAPKLIYGAQKYKLDELKKLSVATMIKNLSIENAVDYFLLAYKYDVKDLLSQCINFIKM